jgi:hypothetical protein
MKKVFGHFHMISDVLIAKSYGMLGKTRSSYYAAFDLNLSDDILECLKDAAVYDSRSKIAHRSQELYPSRDGTVRRLAGDGKKKHSKKRKASPLSVTLKPGEGEGEEGGGGGGESKLLSPLLKTLEDQGSSSSSASSSNLEIDATNSAAEIEEKVRSIKAQRLADAMHHPSYDKLEQEQKDLIKHEWISSLLGLEEKN